VGPPISPQAVSKHHFFASSLQEQENCAKLSQEMFFKTKMLLICFALWVAQAQGAMFTVINTSGDANLPGSLPWALMQANYNGNGLDRIHFNIPGPGPFTITLEDTSSFGGAGGTLYIIEQVVIDGTTQPGYQNQPVIRINANGNASGVFLAAGNGSAILGLNIYNFSSNGITISSGSLGNWIQKNWIGFYISGSQFIKNTDLDERYKYCRGVGIQSSYNVIESNVINGVDNGITVGEPIEIATSGFGMYKTNSFKYNFIGISPDGEQPLGNTSDAIFLGAGAAENWIGPGNVFSGNASAGVELLHPSNQGNVVFSNIIGMNKAATVPVPNGEVGVLFANDATGNAIGGPFGGNFIGYNRLGGVVLGLVAPTPGTTGRALGNWVQYNVFAGNAQAVPSVNQVVGVSIEGGSAYNVVEGNSFVGQAEHGVQIIGSSNNSVSGNWIGMNGYGQVFGNLGFGIFLNGAYYNWIVGNAYGYNALGSIGQLGSGGNIFQ
jgi:parallel beta-helix repeat protein